MIPRHGVCYSDGPLENNLQISLLLYLHGNMSEIRVYCLKLNYRLADLGETPKTCFNVRNNSPSP